MKRDGLRAWAWFGLAEARGFAGAEAGKACIGKALTAAEMAEAGGADPPPRGADREAGSAVERDLHIPGLC